MREAVQVGAGITETVIVGGTARARGTNRAIETQKGVIFMVATVASVACVGKEINVSKTGRSIMGLKRSLVRRVLTIYT
jgi:hypothetical protein